MQKCAIKTETFCCYVIFVIKPNIIISIFFTVYVYSKVQPACKYLLCGSKFRLYYVSIAGEFWSHF